MCDRTSRRKCENLKKKKTGDAKGAVAVSCGQVLGDWWAGGGLEQPAPDQDHDQQILDISWHKYLKLSKEKSCCKEKIPSEMEVAPRYNC